MACEVNNIFKNTEKGKMTKKRAYCMQKKACYEREKRLIKLLKCCRTMHTLNFNT